MNHSQINKRLELETDMISQETDKMKRGLDIIEDITQEN